MASAVFRLEIKIQIKFVIVRIASARVTPTKPSLGKSRYARCINTEPVENVSSPTDQVARAIYR